MLQNNSEVFNVTRTIFKSEERKKIIKTHYDNYIN